MSGSDNYSLLSALWQCAAVKYKNTSIVYLNKHSPALTFDCGFASTVRGLEVGVNFAIQLRSEG